MSGLTVRLERCKMGPGWTAETRLRSGPVKVIDSTASRSLAMLALKLAEKGA